MAVNGRLESRGEVDTYELPVVAGRKLRCEVISHRVGTLLDGTLTIRDSAGNQLAINDDSANTLDPAVTFDVPENCHRIVLSLSSTADNFGPECIYRLSIDEAAAADFSISTMTDRVTVPTGSRTVTTVFGKRAGSDAPIQIVIESGMSSFLHAEPATIEPGADRCLLAIAAEPYTQATTAFHIVGTVLPDGARAVTQLATVPMIAGVSRYSPIQHEIVACVTNKPGLQVEWPDDQLRRLILGARHSLDIRIAPDARITAGRKLRPQLLTSQQPLKKQQENQQIDDTERTLRLADAQPFDGSESGTSRIVELIVPHDLPRRIWDVAVRLDLLATDGTTVVSSGYTTIRRPAAEPAFSLALTSDAKPQVKLPDAKAIAVHGIVIRAAGLDWPIKVFLSGLPSAYGIPETIVPPGQSEFRLEVNLEKAMDAVKLEKLQLESQFAGDVGTEYATIRGAAIPMEITITR
jgi:hypothetical protein